MLLQKTMSDIEHLERDVAMWVMIHNLNENMSSSTSKTNGEEYAKTLLEEIEPKINKINEQIAGLNRISTLLKIPSVKIENVKKEEIRRLVKKRFDVVSDKNSIDLNNENFNLKLSQLLMKTRRSAGLYIESLDQTKKFENLKKINQKYTSQLKDAIDISSMGIHDVAVFTAGRAVEDSINDYLRALMKRKKIKMISLKDYTFSAKIGLLKRDNFLSDKIYHDTSSVLISRNDTGHPKKSRFRREDAFEAIYKANSLIISIEKKIKALNRPR